METRYGVFQYDQSINHSQTWIEINKYKVEPYVMAADVYTVEPHVDEEDGPGILAQRLGCIGWELNGFLV